MSSTEDLITWLRQQWDKDERVAQEAIADAHDDGRWTAGMGGGPAERIDGLGITIYDEGGHTAEQAEHIARWDPDRVLAEVNAKRALLKVIIEYEQTVSGDSGFTVGELADTSALLILAQPYAGQPGWQEEWAA